MPERPDQAPDSPQDERTSLYPLTTEEALRGLLAVKSSGDQTEDSDTEDETTED